MIFFICDVLGTIWCRLTGYTIIEATLAVYSVHRQAHSELERRAFWTVLRQVRPTLIREKSILDGPSSGQAHSDQREEHVGRSFVRSGPLWSERRACWTVSGQAHSDQREAHFWTVLRQVRHTLNQTEVKLCNWSLTVHGLMMEDFRSGNSLSLWLWPKVFFFGYLCRS
jgi:hypothetical protein